MINPATGLDDAIKPTTTMPSPVTTTPSVGSGSLSTPVAPAITTPPISASVTPSTINIGGAPESKSISSAPSLTTPSPTVGAGSLSTPSAPAIPAPATPETILKNENAIGAKIGQTYNATTGQFEPKPVGIGQTTTGQTATSEVVLPVDNTKPHSVGDVWNGKTGNWEMPGTTTQATQTSQVVDQMFPKGQYTDEERKAVTDALASKSPTDAAAFMAKSQQDKYAESQKLLDAYRTTRDFGLTQERTKALNDQRVADLTQQYDNAITNQKQKMEADANNMSVVQGTSGRLQSRNMQNAVTQMLDTNKNLYTQLVSNKDRDIARLGEDLKYAQTTASNEYNDKISQEMQDMLKNISALDKTGSLASAQGLVQARSFVDATISNTMQHQSDYYSKLSYISQRYDQYHKDALAQSAVDDSVTKTMNDGYLYNNQGLRIKGENGGPIRVQNTNGTLLTKEPIQMTDGTKAFVYQNTDGTTRIEKIQGTETAVIDDATAQRYAGLVSSGNLQVNDLAKLGLPQAQLSAIISKIDQTKMVSEKPSDYMKLQDSDGNEYYFNPKTKETVSAAEMAQKVSEPSVPFTGSGKEGETISGAEVMKALASGNLNGKKFFGVYASGDPTGQTRANEYAKMEKTGINADIAKFPNTKITADMINTSASKFGIDPVMLATILKLDSSYGTAGKGARNNNPGNVGQTDTLDAQGVTVKGYKTLEEGVDAVSSNLKNRLKAMSDMTGTSIEPTTASEAPKDTRYTSVAQEIINGITKSSELKGLGYKLSEIKQIESERMRLSSQKAKSPALTEYSQDQKNLMDIVGNNPTKSDLDSLKNAGLSYTDLANYVKTNRGQNKPTTLYDVVLSQKASEGQRNSYKYGLRMSESEDPIRTMEDKYKNSWTTTEWLAPSGMAPNFMKTADRQKYEQAQKDWVNANLRKESGAVISPSEFANAAEQYFPQTGDDSATIDQKRQNRYNATFGMLKEVGRDENGNEIADIYKSKGNATGKSWKDYENKTP